MNNAKALKEARELLQAHVEDDPVHDAYISLTDILVVSTSMESDLMWAYQLCDIALREYPEMHQGLKTQLEGFRNHYEKNY